MIILAQTHKNDRIFHVTPFFFVNKESAHRISEQCSMPLSECFNCKDHFFVLSHFFQFDKKKYFLLTTALSTSFFHTLEKKGKCGH